MLKPCEMICGYACDGQIAYQLAVSYDDGAMGITHVFAGKICFPPLLPDRRLLKTGHPVPTMLIRPFHG